MTSYYSTEEINEIGFKSVGTNVLISRKASLYGVSRMSIGSNVRIDDFCVISAGSGGIEIGSYVHIAVYVSIQGDGKVVVGDFSGISSRTSVYSSNDDYSGEFMSNPMVPAQFTNVNVGDVIIEKHVLIGAGCVVLPGVVIHKGAAVGSMSLVNKNCTMFSMYAGVPARIVKNRSTNLLKLETLLLKQNKN